MSIRIYKMTVASGFAPNPYGGVLSLAACKPGIRRVSRVGDWILGIGSKSIEEISDKKLSLNNKLIFIMNVRRIVSWTEYYPLCSVEFPIKLDLGRAGDCIYRYNNPLNISLDTNFPSCDDFSLLENNNHSEADKKHDLSCTNVLLGDGYFLGEDAIDIDSLLGSYSEKIRNLRQAQYGILYKEPDGDTFINNVLSAAAAVTQKVSQLKDNSEKIKVIRPKKYLCMQITSPKCSAKSC